MSPSPLLCLPQELRDVIYDYLLQGVYLKFKQYDLVFFISYEVPQRDHGLPYWLLANRQILSEGIDQLYRKAVCLNCDRQKTVEKLEELRMNLSEVRVAVPPEVNQGSIGIGHGQLLTIHRIRTVELKVLQIQSYRSGRSSATLFIPTVSAIGPLSQYLKLKPSALTTLKLTFTLEKYYAPIFEPNDWLVHLEPLGKFGPLETIHIRLNQPRIPTDRLDSLNNMRACGAAATRLHEEMIRVAEQMVGGGDQEHKIEKRKAYRSRGDALNRIPGTYDWHLTVKRLGKKD